MENNQSLNIISRNANPQEVKIISWNANGLPAHGEQLKLFIHKSTPPPHIICIQETKFKENPTFKIDGYQVEAKNRKETGSDRGGGGVATFIRTGLPYERIENIPQDKEGVTVKVFCKSKQITVSNIYIPPQSDPREYDFITNIIQDSSKIICGDFNAKNTLWGSSRNDAQGDRLVDVIGENYTVLNNGKGTRLNNDGSYSHLDLAIASNNIAASCNWDVIEDDWNSDHHPTSIIINEEPAIEANQQPRFALTRADWETFADITGSTITDDVITPSVHTTTSSITTSIVEAASRSIPKKKIGRSRMIPYWNDQCKNAVQNKRKAQKKMQRSGNLLDCIAYRKSKAEVQRIIKESGKQHWRDTCSNINSSTKLSSVWKMVKNMQGTRSTHSIPSIKHGGNVLITNQEKAEAFAENFARNSSDLNFEKEFLERREKKILNTNPSPESGSNPTNDPFDLHELHSAIVQCKKNSAPGEDGIEYEMIRRLPVSCLKTILHLYNNIWESGVIPATWKHSIILPIAKPGKPATQLDSYRPISLTDTLCKIQERMVANRLNWYLEKNNLYNPNQAGFRKNRSCQDQIVRLQSDIENGRNHGKYTIGVFLDFTKAYDMMWVEGLLHKIINLGIGGKMFHWIKQFLTNRTFQVKIGEALSQSHHIKNGTPQGSVISPILFLLMINDLPETTDDTKKAIFADDTAIWKTGSDLQDTIKSTQTNLTNIREWCKEWGFILSKDKTVAIIFYDRSPDDPTKLIIDQTELDWKKETKFLGVIFDSRMTWASHINMVINKCKKRINLMRCISGQDWGADKRSLLQIYFAMIRSIIDYGCVAYSTAAPTQLAKIDKIQNHALSICCGTMKCSSSAALQVECGEMPLALRRESFTLKYAIKVKAIEGHPAKDILNPSTKKIGRNKSSFHKRTKPFLDQITQEVQGPLIPETPPWKIMRTTINTALQTKINKKMDPDQIRPIALEEICTYTNFTQVFTDGSKDGRGHVGAAYHVDKIGVQENFRLTNDITVYTAELVAIKEALTFIQKNVLGKVVIFSDSLSAIQSIATEQSNSQPNLLNDVIKLISTIKMAGIDLHLCWIPGHVDVSGNEEADRLAKEALNKTSIDIEVDLEMKEAYKKVDAHIMKSWQDRWNTEVKGRYYHAIQPTVSKTIKFRTRHRKKETTITRLRIGRCGLNHYLHQNQQHNTGKCDKCNVPETIDHYLTECQNNKNLIDELRGICHRKGTPADITNILNIKECCESIFQFIHNSGRRI